MSNDYIPQVLELQDLASIQQAMLSDSSMRAQAKIDELYNNISNAKHSAFEKSHIELARYMNMDHNANFYKIRTGDVDRMTDAIKLHNESIANSTETNKDNTKRQFEINEWYNYNKLETLFFLQLFFISSLCMAILIFLQKNGMITNTAAALATGILILVVVITGVYRYSYTERTRDPRLWHRRKFATVAGPESAPAKCGAGGTLDVDVNSIFPKAATQCMDDYAFRFNQWQKGIQDEMLAYQTSGAPPAVTTLLPRCNVA
jgi:hypothetical protein